MIVLISPAKTLDFATKAKTKTSTTADYLNDSAMLIRDLKKLAPQDVSLLMGISDKLGVLNYDRYQSWKLPFSPDNAKQAVLAFQGDVYQGLDAAAFSAADFKFAQKHLRILSGLYGMLRPLDLIQPYRLEMGTKFKNVRGKDLYEFWGEQLALDLNKIVKKSKSVAIVNLASNEYFKSLKPKLLEAEIVTPVFKDYKNGHYKMISFFAKKARGMMAAYIIKNRLTDVEDLKDFDSGGYNYCKKESSDNKLIFLRKEA